MNGVKLGFNIPLVMLNFKISNKLALPKMVLEREPENCIEGAERLARSRSGIQVIDSTERVFLSGIIGRLAVVGYSLVIAWKHERNEIVGRREKRYWIVRYEFAWRDPSHVPVIIENPEQYEAILVELQNDLCSCTSWRTRAFLNPYYGKKGAVEGMGTISVDCDSRNVDENVLADNVLYIGDQTKNLCLVDVREFGEERGGGRKSPPDDWYQMI